jgi:stage II sporulation protein M
MYETNQRLFLKLLKNYLNTQNNIRQMVLESLTNPILAEKKPYQLFFFGILYASVGILLSLWIFESYSSLVMVFLTTLATTPLIYQTMRIEETKDMEYEEETSILREHSKAVIFLIYLFVGITICFALWYIFLPIDKTNLLFEVQTETIISINSRPTGNAIEQWNNFITIFANNIKVMIFCILFSFVYGIGAIFILIWNASVIGTAIGNYFRSHFTEYAGTVGFMKFWGYFHILPLSIMRYFTHGILEIAAYFVAGLAGGIISVALMKHDLGTKKFEKILLDCSDLILVSLGILVVAAIVEVFITPIFF